MSSCLPYGRNVHRNLAVACPHHLRASTAAAQSWNATERRAPSWRVAILVSINLPADLHLHIPCRQTRADRRTDNTGFQICWGGGICLANRYLLGIENSRLPHLHSQSASCARPGAVLSNLDKHRLSSASFLCYGLSKNSRNLITTVLRLLLCVYQCSDMTAINHANSLFIMSQRKWWSSLA